MQKLPKDSCMDFLLTESSHNDRILSSVRGFTKLNSSAAAQLKSSLKDASLSVSLEI